MSIEVVAFDGDDTLWHNETLFSVTQERFRELLAPYTEADVVNERLLDTEMRNLRLFGYGIKGFTLSMIETAIEVSDGRVTAAEVQEIIDAGKSMLDHPVDLLEGAREAVEAVAEHHRVMLITKGDLFDQESKLARSGLGDLFWKIEIVSEKDVATYRRILAFHQIGAEEFVMVGNSLRSDIVPVVTIGGRAVHVPYHITWVHEHVDPADLPAHGFTTLGDLWSLPQALVSLD
jgi:putative hydrolase of the HAD superfamily